MKTVSSASMSSAPRQNISTKLQQVKREKETETKEGKKSERVKRNIITKKFYAAKCGTLRNERDKNVELFMIIAFQKTNAVSFFLLILCFTAIVRREKGNGPSCLLSDC